jgi:hypothetical protein
MINGHSAPARDRVTTTPPELFVVAWMLIGFTLATAAGFIAAGWAS